MGTALCGHLAASTVTLLTEWVTMGGVGHVGEGVTYDVQATRSAGSVYLAIWRGSERGSGSTPAVTSESGALRAQWPDGTVVLMTKGKDTAPNRAIVVDPAFDVFHG